MGLKESMVRACVRHMNDCVRRIEELKSLKIDESFEDQVKPLIAKEVEDCINEYLRTYNYLMEKLEETSKTPVYEEEVDIEEVLNVRGAHYELLMGLLQRNGVVTQEGVLTEKGSKLLEQELVKKEEPKTKEIIEPKNYEAPIVEEEPLPEPKAPIRAELHEIYYLEDIEALEKKIEEDEYHLTHQIEVPDTHEKAQEAEELVDEESFLEHFEAMRKIKGEFRGLDLSEEPEDVESQSFEDELRYLMEHRKAMEPIEEVSIVICPKCLSKVKLDETCWVCGNRLIPEKVMELEPWQPAEEAELDVYVEPEPVLVKDFVGASEAEIVERVKLVEPEPEPLEETPTSKPEESEGHELIGGFVSYFAIAQGLIMLSGCLFIILLNENGMSGSAQALSELLFSMVDTFPGVPFSSGILKSLNFWQMIALIGVFGVAVTLIGIGLWRDNKQAKTIGVIVFILASLIDIYNILIVDISVTLMPFYGLVINVVLIYLMLFRLTSKD